MQTNRAVHASLLALFLASGCAALIYEVVWFQQLGLSLGASAVSLAIVLTSFMGGMCLGSFLFPKLVSRKWHPLAVYGCLELMLAACGVVILWSLPFVGQLYWSFAQTGTADLALRAVFALLVLLPPTMLMGATLPAVSRAFESSPDGMAWLGRFYAANTLGAVAGCLASGLYLLRVHDVFVATSVAVLLNIGVGLAALAVRKRLPYQASQVPTTHDLQRSHPVQRTATGDLAVGLVIGASGLTALGSEVVWTRLLALLFGPTVYTFSLILAVFLFGLSVGSSLGSMLVRRVRSPGLALAINQLLLTLAIPFAGYMIIGVIPFWWGGDRDLIPLTTRMLQDVIRAAAALFPATCLWGASFPLAIAAVSQARRGRARRNGDQLHSDDANHGHYDNGTMVGRLYAANTLGAVVGALGISLLAVPMGGSRFALQVVTLLAGCSGLLMLALDVFGYGQKQSAAGNTSTFRPNRLAFASLILLAIASPSVIRLVPVVPNGLLAWGRVVDQWLTRDYVYVAEGLDSAIVITDRDDGMRSFHVAGKVEASTTTSDMRTQRLLGHLPSMIHGKPKKVLVICCGSGMTAGAVLQRSTVEKLTLCEIERHVTIAARQYFSEQNHGALSDPRLEIVIDDGRHFLATTKEKFDIISTDPIHPWVRGAASLYTEEFYRLCREHLNPGGVVTQWVPLYESSEAAVKCELATLLKVFPHASLYSGQGQNNGYDVIAVGMLDETRLDPGLLTMELFTTPEIRESLAYVGYGTPESFQDAFVAYGSELTDWLKDAEINRDSNLRLQYLAGLTQAPQSEQGILTTIRQHRRQTGNQSAVRFSGMAN